jgi:hypothetical protein
MEEEWRKVPGIPLLWASNIGRIKAEKRDRMTTRVRNGVAQTYPVGFPEKILCPWVGRHGYLTVSIAVDKTRKKHLVHRLIGMCFIDGYSPELHINHLDGDKLNNSLDNLEWTSNTKNVQHAWATGLVNLRGENQPGAKLTYQKVKIIREMLKKGVTPHSIGVLADICPTMIYRIRDGEAWNSLAA